MQSIYENKILKKYLHSLNKEGTLQLPKKLGEKNFAKPLNVLKNWDLVRTFAINRYKLTSVYIHLLE